MHSAKLWFLAASFSGFSMGCMALDPADFESNAADIESSADIIGTLEPAKKVSFRLKADQKVHGYVFHAVAGTTARFETWSKRSIRMAVRGPRAAGGSFASSVHVSVDSAGSGRKVGEVAISESGDYLIEVRLSSNPPANVPEVPYELTLDCAEGCSLPAPFKAPGLEVQWFRNSAEQVSLYLQSYRLADRLMAEQLELQNGPTSWAVVSDIDETVLDNSLYQKERAELGLGYSSGSFTAWVRRQAAPATPGAREFFTRVRELGGHVALVSNRTAEECPDTQANVLAQGIPVDVVLCRTDTKEKEPRFAMIENGSAGIEASPILLFLGDAIGDFPELTQDDRLGDRARLAPVGSTYVVMANPMYGSWVENPAN